jgi:hypothetical protein
MHWNKPVCHLKMVKEMWNSNGEDVSDRVNDQQNDFSIPLFTDCVSFSIFTH